MTRYLGTAYAAVHAPRPALDFAAWVLGRGFRGVQPGAAPLPVDWAGLARVGRETGFEFAPALPLAPAETPEDDRPDRSLAARGEHEREVSLAAVRAAADRAERLGLDTVIVQPGRIATPAGDEPVDLTGRVGDFDPGPWASRRAVARDAALDAACRSLHTLLRGRPGLRICLVAGRSSDTLLDPAGLVTILEDLAGLRLGYWHDAAVVAARSGRLGEDQGAWLEAGSRCLVGLSAGDWADGAPSLPPGAGVADYPLIASELRAPGRDLPVVVELDPSLPPAELPGVHAFLAKCGL